MARTELILETVGLVNHGNPDVPFSAKWDHESILKIDPKPFYVTLPLGTVGGESKNNRQYTKQSVQRIVEMINTKLIAGNRGHLTLAERSSKFDLPVLRWAGAVMGGDTAWGKAYVPTYANDVREYMEISEAVQTPVATSLYAWADMQGNKVLDLDVETIDLAAPERAGVHDAIAVPKLTREMSENSMAEENKTELITEQTAELAKSKQLITELEKQVESLAPAAAMVSKCTKLISESADSFVTMNMNISASGNDLFSVIEDMIEKLKGMQQTIATQTMTMNGQSMTITEMTLNEMVPMADLRPVVKALIGEQVDSSTVRQRIENVMQQPHIMRMAKALVVEQSGGNFTQSAVTPEKQADHNREETVKNAPELANKFGLNTSWKS